MFFCKLVPILLIKTVQILFIFCILVQFLFNCKTVPLVSLIAYWSLSSFFTVSSQKPRRQSSYRCHHLIGSGTHMAAYKRPPLYKSESEIHKSVPHHKQLKNFSLHSVRSKTITNSRNWRKLRTLTVSEAQFKQDQWSLFQLSEIQWWIFIIEPCPLQFKRQIRHKGDKL